MFYLQWAPLLDARGVLATNSKISFEYITSLFIQHIWHQIIDPHAFMCLFLEIFKLRHQGIPLSRNLFVRKSPTKGVPHSNNFIRGDGGKLRAAFILFLSTSAFSLLSTTLRIPCTTSLLCVQHTKPDHSKHLTWTVLLSGGNESPSELMRARKIRSLKISALITSK